MILKHALVKTCPFCGKNADLRYDYATCNPEYAGFYVCCSNTKCIANELFKKYGTELEAIIAWNERVNE